MKKCSTGVYTITNLVNGKVYVGSAARSFTGRWNSHKSLLRRNKHWNTYLQNSWNAYGEEKFVFKVIHRCPPEKCIVVEQLCIRIKNSANFSHGYNRSPTAGNSLGVKRSDECKQKASIRMTGKKMPEGTGEKISIALKGRSKSEEHKRKIGENSKKLVHTEETKKRISESLLTNGGAESIRQKATGRKHTAETKAKMSANRKGRKFTDEHKANLAASVRRAKNKGIV